MRHLKSLPLALALFFLGLANTKAQQTVVSAGGENTSNDGSLSYSVGQLAYTEFSSDNGSASEGVQQAMVISVVAGVDYKDINLSVSTYPNPTTDHLTIQVENPAEELSASLFDVRGLLLKTYPITSEETTVDMSDLISSVYLLSVSRRKGRLKTFRIIKE